MKKTTLLGMTLLIGLAMVVAPMASNACNSCPAHASKATSCGPKSMTSDAGSKSMGCGTACVKACCADKASKAKMGAEEMGSENMSLVTFSVKGMTCGGCEAQVNKELTSQDGVSEVMQVSHKKSEAVLKYDPKKVNAEELAKIITKLGYKAEVVSTSVDMMEKKEGTKSKQM